MLPLLQAEMQDSTFNLDIMPSGLQLDAAIGNLRARDRSYGKEFMYSNICDLRAEGNINSFIELKYSTHKVNGPGGIATCRLMRFLPLRVSWCAGWSE